MLQRTTLLYLFMLVLFVNSKRFKLKTFKVKGTLVFPKTGVYTEIPDGSCLNLQVGEAIMDDAPNQIGGEKVVRQFQFTGNKLLFEIDSIYMPMGYYTVSATLNVGWCGEHIKDEWIRRGDYHNAFAYDIRVKPNDTLKIINPFEMELYESPELCGKYRCSEKYQCKIDGKGNGYCECKNILDCPRTTATTTTTTTTTNDPGMVFGDAVRLSGTIILPSQGYYALIPEGSCLFLKVEDNANCMDSCQRNIVYTKSIYQLSVVNKRILFDFKIYDLKRGFYSISAVLNVGWCAIDRSSLNTKNGDYFNDVSHVFEVTWGEREEYEEIKMIPFKQYMCGDKMCFEKEVCNVRNNRTSCDCIGVACGDLMEPDYVCGNNGQTYVSECWMKMTDCFSGTIQKVHDGECNSKGGERGFSWLSRHEYSVALPIAGIALLLIIVVVVLMIKHRRRSVKSLPVKYDDKPPAYETVDYLKKSPEKEDVFVDVPPPQYESPPEYKENEEEFNKSAEKEPPKVIDPFFL